MFSSYLLTALCSTAMVSASPIVKRTVSAPVITVDFPDPSVYKEGDTWYAFASQSKFDNKNIHVQLAQSSDFNTWSRQDQYDALPNLPGWATDNGEVWAPDVVRLNDGQYLMYFAATPASDDTKKCVGTARSPSIRGPYQPDDQPFECASGQGGALDASGYLDEDGTRYVLWKVDANSLGNGGTCGNTVAPIVTTPIIIQQVEADGTTRIGDPYTILTNDPVDGPLVEAPVLVKVDGTYILFFSNNCYYTPEYATSYATSKSPTGGFSKADRPLYVKGGKEGLSGPGGLDVTVDGSRGLIHALQEGGRRFMHTVQLSYADGGTRVVG